MRCPHFTSAGCTWPACGTPAVVIGDEGDKMGPVEFAPCEIDDMESGRHMWHPGAYDGAPAPRFKA